MADFAFPSFSTEVNHYNRMKQAAASRDGHMSLARSVREGNIRQLFPSELSLNLTFNGVPIANFIDIVARDLSEALAPLPALACTAGEMKTDADQRRAEMKNRIGDWYWSTSRLEQQMLSGADRYLTYGFLPFFVEPNVEGKRPYIQVDDPVDAYYEKNRFGEVVFYAKRWNKRADDLCAMFPEYTSYILTDPDSPTGKRIPGDAMIEVVRWVDKKSVTLFLPTRKGLILTSYEHKLDCAPVVIAERPGCGSEPRGQFDDVIWTQVARAIFSTLSLEAAAQAVEAPIAVPSDMDEFPIGPNTILQSDNAKDIHRVNLELPPGLFQENAVLDQELKMGSRYPDARAGNTTASVITGRGIEALMGSFDTQIKGAQMVFRQAFQDVTSLCFQMDEKWWGKTEKVIAGTISNKSYEVKYTPSAAINGRYTCTVTYGFAAGMKPSQAFVAMLQLEGAGIIAKGTTMLNMPFDIDPDIEQRNIDVEATRDALKQGLFSLVQSAGPIAEQGGDPSLLVKMAADIVKARQNGQSMEDAATNGFAAYQAALQQKAQEQQSQMSGPGDQGQAGMDSSGGQGGGLPGADSNGLPPGVAPGQAGLPPGGQPSVQNLIAGFRGNGSLPIDQATIQRRVPTGTR